MGLLEERSVIHGASLERQKSFNRQAMRDVLREHHALYVHGCQL